MDNILTPEQAKMPVTYGELLAIFKPVMDEVAKHSTNYADTLQDGTLKIINKLTDHLVVVQNDADYKRQRDIRFVLGYLARLWGCDKDMMYDSYKHWCEEFDKLNKPQQSEDKKDG